MYMINYHKYPPPKKKKWLRRVLFGKQQTTINKLSIPPPDKRWGMKRLSILLLATAPVMTLLMKPPFHIAKLPETRDLHNIKALSSQ